MKLTFKKPYDKFRHHVRKNCASLRRDGYVYIPKSIAEKCSKLNFEACQYYEVYPSEQDPLIVGVKFMSEMKSAQTCRKSQIERSGLSVNLNSYFKSVGVKAKTTQEIKEISSANKKILILDFNCLGKNNV